MVLLAQNAPFNTTYKTSVMILHALKISVLLFFMRIKEKSFWKKIHNALKKMRKRLNCTTVQAQFFMERVELILDLLWTGAVLTCTEIQQDVDLEIDRTRR